MDPRSRLEMRYIAFSARLNAASNQRRQVKVKTDTDGVVQE